MDYRRRIRRLLKKLPKNNQHGFTLIELLVVISILGILAAVVTMSMVGITKVAQDRAGATEKQTVQVAMDTMLADQGVPAGSECGITGQNPAPAGGTSDMSTFPTNTTVGSAGTPHIPVALYPTYLRQKSTHGVYQCTPSSNGSVFQAQYNP